jgi:TM2 domain-containing membrane protein YozV
MESDERACPLCGETIKQVAIRCKHCHGDLRDGPADFDRGMGRGIGRGAGRGVIEPPVPQGDTAELEQRFLEFAYKTAERINAPVVAHALKIPISQASDFLEDLAARDALSREVDDEGQVWFEVPGRKQQRALVKRDAVGSAIAPPPPPQAMLALLLNLVAPGVGSIVGGRTVEGILQLVLLLIGLPLCFILVGIPLCIATWGWALSTGLRVMNEASRQEETRRRDGTM